MNKIVERSDILSNQFSISVIRSYNPKEYKYIDRTPILFIKSELHGERLASFCNWKFLFHKISVI